MVWKEILSKTSEYLDRKGVPDARVASELLAARLLHVGRGLLAGELEKEAPEKCLEAMRRGMVRLVKGEPLQYVLGEWDFRTLTLKCDRRALIPRPETEELVTRVLKFLESGEAESFPLREEEPSRNFSTRVTSSSVSGRGMRARRSQASVNVRKSHSPSTYCNGSPFTSRAMPRRIASRHFSGTSFSSAPASRPRPT